MTRPLRIEFAGALYHVTSRGDRREDIYPDDEDREAWLDVLSLVCERFNWLIHAYCQMTNHYHLLVETVDGNLSRGMRQLNGRYTQRFNRRHGLAGHLYQGRYTAILVQKESYLQELSRYVVLNPLRAGIVERPEDWPWSSYGSTAGLVEAPDWFDEDWILNQFGGSRRKAVLAYEQFVLEGIGLSNPLEQTRHQLLLGDDSFVDKHRNGEKDKNLRELSKAHRRSLVLSLEQYAEQGKSRDESMARAYRSGAYTMAEIGDYFGVHYMTVSRAVRKFEDRE